jgi:adenosylhomocysteine nucleosidase
MINIVTALACEANPIIQRYGLKKSPHCGTFPVYKNGFMALIITGMGKYASATAVGFLQSLLNSALVKTEQAVEPHVWLNVGIAGHKTLDVGTALLAQKISDLGAYQYFYPCFTFDVPCVTGEVITVDNAETQYPVDAAYDMEALGFCAAASRFSGFEMIHCLKIISDNASVSQERITRHLGEELVANQLPLLDALLGELRKIQAISAKMYILPQDYYALTQVYRFTVTQQNQLKRLLLRWRVLMGSPVKQEMDISQYNNAKQLLAAIENRLQSIAFTY